MRETRPSKGVVKNCRSLAVPMDFVLFERFSDLADASIDRRSHDGAFDRTLADRFGLQERLAKLTLLDGEQWKHSLDIVAKFEV